MERDLDLVLFGATGYVGALTARYLASHAPTEMRIAVAGRSPDKLRQARDALGAAAGGGT
ncbi:saccharopine dehydrogenase NADP-binding domain-containing protein [Rhodococcus tibetensis]|uniref:Saccharopine dehydrogenase NADP-binding domain-containing protein n=1 Tax=Rhodococcus tibetensis TaxID=2965064 RepID=A0ABT1QGP2_9NOCA|nr:saccharopine dehydrogenase NADP-binding domain-containing protein [Rhodococcus sp. FXJ9.536]MCQ4121357.1 saccharopine dehydrogenase NADP-binding domain-containing protein [Rhodococcus sp. FXJ9.536]